jgi:hypothetical protein
LIVRRAVLELARLVREAGFDDLPERLETAYDRETRVLALTIDGRKVIIRSRRALARARVAGEGRAGLAPVDSAFRAQRQRTDARTDHFSQLRYSGLQSQVVLSFRAVLPPPSLGTGGQ